ncbi:nucleotidyltransferase domain-containing protein [Treponema sp. J25]|jgi:predicted nucleotidyltransferase|uniref:nucleotidyltransferase domain-containing protein n=1 Tax=Treponema sp. J25 TaxID=2094121 RepID=UPI00104EBD65|nr:nucleotidyltransferase domain-containing protein [Treponema sp. J25]TCW60805.1 nucleotidyltransferase domain-containing protein [Treponema sp. J25]
MIDIETVKALIVERLKPLNPYKVILFGSYAYGTPNEESDIDLYVVTNDDFIPQNWKQKSEIYLKYSQAIRDLQKIIAVDLIVHTKKMYEKLIDLDGSFYRYSLKKGIEL